MITMLKARILDQLGPGQQNHLADRCRINRGRFSQYSTGIVAIPAHHLLILARELECSPPDLIGYCDVDMPTMSA